MNAVEKTMIVAKIKQNKTPKSLLKQFFPHATSFVLFQYIIMRQRCK